jgi:hypothetical protein
MQLGGGDMALFGESEVRAAARSVESHLYKSADGIFRAEIRDVPITQSFRIFLCHSFNDAQIILGLKTVLEDMGHSVYIDHQVDPQLNRQHETPETADQLRARMQHCEALLFATSDNSANSKWMPWELGYFDGHKGRVAILPLVPDYTMSDTYAGQEYLGIYPYVTRSPAQDAPGDRLWVHWSSDWYVVFEAWLRGEGPTQH